MSTARWLVSLAIVGSAAAGMASACGTSPIAPDASADDATFEKKVPPGDAGDADAGPFVGPTRLSDTGLYSDFASRTLAPGIITYEPRYPLWSDGLEKKRYLLLPPSTKIDTSSMDEWAFPIGTKVWKEFDVDGGAIETRLLWKIADAEWWEVAYAWTSDATDALAAPDGGVNALGTTHDIPSQTDCNACHTGVRDVLIGVSALQLGASDGDGTLDKLAEAGALSNPPTVASFDVPGSGATKDALGYLHGNCGHCHNSDYADPKLQQQTAMRLRLSVSLTTPEAAPVYATAMCLVMKHAVPPNNLIYALVPGQPDWSGIPARMARRDSFEMPPNCTEVVDDAGVATVRAWITSIDASACPDASTD